MIWFRSLRKEIPLPYSLAVSFLACHLAREAILPTDIVKWSLEGKLPYFAAFVDIENVIGPPPKACPISSSLMFRPLESITLQKLEAMTASIAESIGLDLPPVNFYAIASRYIEKLSLPAEKILPHACRIYEWSMPPDLWLSTNELRLPTRVCVMSILIVAIRILYNIHGFGDWERRLSSNCASSSTSNWTGESDLNCSPEMRDDAGSGSGSSPNILDDSGTNPVRNASHAQKSELDAAELLTNLEATYNKIDETYGNLSSNSMYGNMVSLLIVVCLTWFACFGFSSSPFSQLVNINCFLFFCSFFFHLMLQNTLRTCQHISNSARTCHFQG